jgi:hypothetical protein
MLKSQADGSPEGARAVTPLANLPDMTADELPNKLLHNDGSHTRESQTPASGVLNVPMILGEEDGSRYMRFSIARTHTDHSCFSQR